MSAATVKRLIDLPDPAAALAEIETIFFLTSPTGGTLQGGARRQFLRQWTGYYVAHCRSSMFVAEVGDGIVAGYLMGCLESLAAAPLYDDIFYYRHFAALFPDYPAHFHINCHPDWQGRGVGAALVDRFVAQATAAGLPGVHVVTARAARNRRFYHRLGFVEAASGQLDGRDLVLLARVLP